MIDLTIIIINYKNEQLTISFVKEQLSKLKTEFKLIIVNNSSTPDSDSALCEALDLSLVKGIEQAPSHNLGVVISSFENLGFAKGNNLAALYSNKFFKTSFLLFSNNDIVLCDGNVVETLLSKMHFHKDVGLIGPDCLDTKGISQSPRPYIPFTHKYIYSYWITLFVTKMRKVRLFNFDYPERALEGDHYKLSGSFLLARSSDFFLSGMMDPNTFLYCEEEILTERMYKIGKRVYFCPSSKVVHEQSRTVGKFISLKKKMKLEFESNCYYYQTYKGVPTSTILFGKFNHFFFFYIKSFLGR
jgi:N-acetylglucosaminyl-diphospho-decaprenol L-rhamnosyltransferase